MYEITFWEVLRIIKGYRRRGRLHAELLRLCAWSSFYAFRKNEKGELPHEFQPLPWEMEEKGKGGQAPSEEEVEEMQNLMRSAREGQLFGDPDKLEENNKE